MTKSKDTAAATTTPEAPEYDMTDPGVLVLRDGIPYGDGILKVIKLGKYDGGTIRGIGVRQIDEGILDPCLTVISRIAMPHVTEEQLRRVTLHDAVRVIGKVQSFFG